MNQELQTRTRSKTECICITCKVQFYVWNCYIKRDGKRLYCSLKCRNMEKENNPRYKPNEGWVVCGTCSVKFKIKPSQIINGKGKKYCSKKCYNNKHGLKQIKCKECGKGFNCYPSHLKRSSFCSRPCASRNRYRINNQMNKGIQRGRGGKREDLKDQYFRSSWEANYARYLNFLIKHNEIIKWEYEADTFEFTQIKKGTRFYTPDFKIYNTNSTVCYHEVKGWMDKKSVTRHSRMKKYYPGVEIKIIDKSWFRLNGKTLKNIIPNWEISY